MSITKFARKFEVSSTNLQITSQAGAVFLRSTARAVGLGQAVEKYLHLKRRRRGHSEAQSVLAITEAIAMGATCLDDLVVSRSDVVQQQLRGFSVPAPQTAGFFIRRFTLGHLSQLNKALEQVHLRALRLLKAKAVTLDFDSSRRQGSDPTYLKRYALHPLFCVIAETGTYLHAKLRRGRAATGNGIIRFVGEALRRIPKGIKVRARFDSGFYSEPLFEHLENKGVTYLCGVPLTSKILAVIRQIGEESWRVCSYTEGEVAEFGLCFWRGKKFRRYIVKRIDKNQGEQLDLQTGAYNYFVSVTNDHISDAEAIESEHRHKAQIEPMVRELKENFGLHVLRKHEFMANWAWILLVATAHNLVRWTQLLGKFETKSDLRAKRFRYRYLNVPALLVLSGRRLILKLRSDYPLLRVFVAALARLQRLPQPAI